MAVALSPADFDCSAAAPDGSAWNVFDETYETNPKLLLVEDDFEMVRLWSLYRAGHLPDEGGTMKQPTAMLDAFDVMSGAAAELRQKKAS